VHLQSITISQPTTKYITAARRLIVKACGQIKLIAINFHHYIIMEQVEVAPPVTAKPAEYQPVPTAGINANYPVSWHDINKS
jgi:hypothetical protein